MPADIPSNRAGIAVVTAARRIADDEANCFAFVEIVRVGVPGVRTESEAKMMIA